ncbi:MAG: hypothetical protein ACK52L_02950 [Pirellula sp.]
MGERLYSRCLIRREVWSSQQIMYLADDDFRKSGVREKSRKLANAAGWVDADKYTLPFLLK